MRFVNDLDYHNTKALGVIHNNRWKFYYITISEVKKDQ
jgi:hypothetical protein